VINNCRYILLLVAVLLPACACAQERSTPTSLGEHAKSVPKDEGQTKTDIFEKFKIEIQDRIKRAYFPPKGNESQHIVVQFHVHRHGEVSDVRLVRASGIEICDRAALKAVENAAPFRPLPEGAKEEEVFEITLDYNAFSLPPGQAVKHLQ
jgi:TonB family protein